MGGIRVSEKHGVNPSLMLCFFCGESVGVALMGRLPGDKEAPRSGVFDMQPCDKCKEWMSKGIILMSVRAGEQPSSNPYRTGGWCVVTEEAFRRMFSGPEAESALKARWCFMDDQAWDQVGLPREVRAEKQDAS